MYDNRSYQDDPQYHQGGNCGNFSVYHNSIDDGGDIVTYVPPPTSGNRHRNQNHHSLAPRQDSPFQPFVIILVGIPGSGKSHFASHLAAMSSKFIRINQDTLGSRQDCEFMMRRALYEGKIPVVDRCNIDSQQRKYFVDIAEEAGAPCECVVFLYDKKTCIKRCEQRRNHETINPHNARDVVERMASLFRPPVARSRHSNYRGNNVRCSVGEMYRRVVYVFSFKMAHNLAETYLSQQ